MRKPRTTTHMQKLFETRSHSWREAGLARQLSARAVRRARVGVLVNVPLIIGVLVLYKYREQIFGVDVPVRIATVFALVALGWQFARDLGRAFGPTLFRRLDPATAGTVGFLVRLVDDRHRGPRRAPDRRPEARDARGRWCVQRGHRRSRRAADLRQPVRRPRAAQRPPVPRRRPRPPAGRRPRRHDRGRRQLAGAALHHLRERRRPDHGPQQRRAQRRGDPAAASPTASTSARACAPASRPSTSSGSSRRCSNAEVRDRPKISLEEIDGDEVVVRIQATPRLPSDGPRLATEVLQVVHEQSRRGRAARGPQDRDGAARARTEEHERVRRRPAPLEVAVLALPGRDRLGDPACPASRATRADVSGASSANDDIARMRTGATSTRRGRARSPASTAPATSSRRARAHAARAARRRTRGTCPRRG